MGGGHGGCQGSACLLWVREWHISGGRGIVAKGERGGASGRGTRRRQWRRWRWRGGGAKVLAQHLLPFLQRHGCRAMEWKQFQMRRGDVALRCSLFRFLFRCCIPCAWIDFMKRWCSGRRRRWRWRRWRQCVLLQGFPLLTTAAIRGLAGLRGPFLHGKDRHQLPRAFIAA